MSRTINARDILKRWQGIQEEELAMICVFYCLSQQACINVYNRLIRPYLNLKMFYVKDGFFSFHFICKPYQFNDIMFDLCMVEKFEEKNSWVKIKNIDNKVICERIRLLIGMDKSQFIFFLNNCKDAPRLVTSYENKYMKWKYSRDDFHGEHSSFFNPDMLDNDDFYIECSKLRRYLWEVERDFLDSLKKFTFADFGVGSVSEKDSVKLETVLVGWQYSIDDLLVENKKLTDNIKALELELHRNRAKGAREARRSNDLSKWKAALPAMVKLCLSIFKDEPRKYTEAELKKALKKNGDELTSTQFDAIRNAIPAEYKHGVGAKPIGK